VILDSIIKFFQFIGGSENLWNLYNRPIEKGTLVFANTDDTTDTELIAKLGNGNQKYSELSEIFRISDVAAVSKLDIFDVNMSDINHILFIDTDGKIRTSDITEAQLDNLYAQINNISFSTAVSVLIINGFSEVSPGDTFTLEALAVSSFFNEGVAIESYEWILPNESSSDTNPLTYTVPNDSGLIGSTLEFKVKATDELGFSSTFTSVEINIVMSSHSSIITNTTIELE
jgi:hypothetical protein